MNAGEPRPIVRERVYTNYRMTLPEEESIATLVVRDGLIADIQPGFVAAGENGHGHYLMPGFVDLHTDHFEKCSSPRPGVYWPLASAALFHDRSIAVAGITTVCDAISINRPERRGLSPDFLLQFTGAISHMARSGAASVEHRLHLRCELSYGEVVTHTEALLEDPHVALVSLMDHTPGTGQYRDLEHFKGTHSQSALGEGTEDFDEFVERRRREQAEFSESNRRRLVALLAGGGFALATHDDTDPEHVARAHSEGATISEFPCTVEAAREARRLGLSTVMGSPNFVLGRSHSGNVSAGELASLGLVDVIASDYVPQSMLGAVFAAAVHGRMPLYEAVKLASENPAHAIGLEDRGRLEIGKRADFITVATDSAVPRITGVFVRGNRVA
jgi:alpha-D-ribose 1-methylphosphonate 5-triphosphate diphosphatase